MAAAWLKSFDPLKLTAERIDISRDGLTVRRTSMGQLAFTPAPGTRAEARISFEHGCWHLQPLGEVQLNGQPVGNAPVLQQGDVIGIGQHALGFGQWPEARNSKLEAAIIAERESRAAVLVYADWLQEHGDPLGERIVQPRTAASDELWLDGLWREVVAGRLEVTWRDGLVDRAVVREASGAGAPFRSTLTRLLSLRAAGLLRGLQVDLLCSEGVPLSPEQIARSAAALIAQLPPLPALESLSLGYCLTGREKPPAITVGREDSRFPRLDPAAVFTWASEAVFEVLEAARLDGARVGARVPAAGIRIRLLDSRVVLGSVREPQGNWKWPFSVDAVGGRILLSTGTEQDQVQVNGRSSFQFFLLPGDLIEVVPAGSVGAAAKFRFALERS